MALVYWEQQGADLLCGVHCLNSLLQGPVYSASDLATIAGQLDEEEARLIGLPPGSSGTSQNVDASGNFSIGVLERALQRAHAGVQVINMQRSDVKSQVLSTPEGENGFICNLHDHWYTVRKVGGKWYNMNSLRQGAPTEISEFHLASFLLSVSETGWTIFVIRGPPLPEPMRRPLMTSHQFYLDATQIVAKHKEYEDKERREMEEAQRIGGGDAGSAGDGDTGSAPAFTVIAPSGTKKPEATDWNKLGAGQTLSGAPSAAAAPAAVDDPDLAAALAASMQDLAGTLEPPAAEPPTGEGLAIQVRMPSGKALKRRFAWDHSLLEVCKWLEYTAAGDAAGTLEGPPGALGCPSLVGSYQLMTQTFPPSARKKYQRTVGGDISSDGEEVTKTLKDLGFARQEMLILQA